MKKIIIALLALIQVEFCYTQQQNEMDSSSVKTLYSQKFENYSELRLNVSEYDMYYIFETALVYQDGKKNVLEKDSVNKRSHEVRLPLNYNDSPFRMYSIGNAIMDGKDLYVVYSKFGYVHLANFHFKAHNRFEFRKKDLHKIQYTISDGALINTTHFRKIDKRIFLYQVSGYDLNYNFSALYSINTANFDVKKIAFEKNPITVTGLFLKVGSDDRIKELGENDDFTSEEMDESPEKNIRKPYNLRILSPESSFEEQYDAICKGGFDFYKFDEYFDNQNKVQQYVSEVLNFAENKKSQITILDSVEGYHYHYFFYKSEKDKKIRIIRYYPNDSYWLISDYKEEEIDELINIRTHRQNASYYQKLQERVEIIRDSKRAITIEHDGKYGIMSSFSGKQLTPVKYDSIFSCYEYSENDNRIVVVEENGRYGLVDEQTGEEILSPAESPITAFTDEVIFPFAPQKWTINGKETFLHSPVYDTATRDVGNGCKMIYHRYRFVIRGYEAVCEKYRVGMIDESGELLVPVKYTSIKDSCFKNGFSIVEVAGKHGVIDSTGMEIVPCDYEDIWWSGSMGGLYGESNWHSDNPIHQETPIWPVVAMKNKKMGVVNISGEEIIPFEYDKISPVFYGSDNFFKVECGNKYGLYDKAGKIISSCKYDTIEYALSEKLYVKQNNKWGIIDFEANIVMPFIELDLAPEILTENGSIVIKGCKAGKWGLLNTKGSFILPARYNSLYIHSSNKNKNTFLAWISDRYVEIDIKGNVIKEIEVEVEIVEEETENYSFVTKELIPEYPGGNAGLFKYLYENLSYPEEAFEYDIEGKVLVDFIVRLDGSVSDVRVSVLSKGVLELLKDEANWVVRRLPKWKPAPSRGKTVPIRCTLPIEFRLIRTMQGEKPLKIGLILIHEMNIVKVPLVPMKIPL